MYRRQRFSLLAITNIMNFHEALVPLLAGKNLSGKQAFSIFLALFEEKLSKAQAKSLLLLLAKKGESPGELQGCLEALRKLEPPRKTGIRRLMDTCGTGGDGKGSLNISTLAAFVIAGAGGKVAKHGNRSISSSCGSSDLVEALGVKLDAGPGKMIAAIRQCGIGYFHAPFYHPVFARVQGLRRELKTRTIFNLLGPLANPLELEGQLVGVARKKNLRLFAEALRKRKIRRALVCRGADGLDEISAACETDAAWVSRGRIRYKKIKPGDRFSLSFPRKSLDFAKTMSDTGTLSKNKSLALGILRGKTKGYWREMVVLNGAAGLVVAGRAKSLPEASRLAEESLDSGRAYAALRSLVRISRGRRA